MFNKFCDKLLKNQIMPLRGNIYWVDTTVDPGTQKIKWIDVGDDHS